MIKTIAILGGSGYTGKRVAYHLLGHVPDRIILIARNFERLCLLADQLNKQFQGERVTTIQADASEPAGLSAALEGVDLLIVAAPLTSAPCETVINTALSSGVDYLDVQIGNQKLELLNSYSAEILKRGLCFITEAGFHPGLPAAMVRYAAMQMDRIDSAIVGGYLNMAGSNIPYTNSVDELMEMLKEYQSQVFKNGNWSKPNSYSMRKIDFGGDIGNRNCFSMYFPELQTLPQSYPSLKQLGFYLSETHWFLDYVITYLVLLGIKLFPKKGMRPLGKLMWWGMNNLPHPPHRVELFLDAMGENKGKKVTTRLHVSHMDGYELTAIPVVAAIIQMLDGNTRKPGLWMMGHLVDPGRLLLDMQKIGATVQVD